MSNSENVSEKPRRGRPKAYNDAIMNMLRHQFPEIETGRGLQNVDRMLEGMKVIRGDKRCKWLLDEERIAAGEKAMRRTLLSELGRIEDEDDRLAMALRLCELKPSTRDGIGMIRRFRGQQRPTSVLNLYDTIATTINRYLAEHRDCTKAKVVDVLQTIIDSIQDDLQD